MHQTKYMLQPLNKTFSLGQQQQHCHESYVSQSQRKKLTNLPASFGINLLLLFNETSKSDMESHTPESSYFLYQFRNIPASMIVTAVSLELIWRRRYKNWWLFFSMPFQWEKMYGWAKKGYAFLVDRIGIQFGLMSLTIKASGIDGWHYWRWTYRKKLAKYNWIIEQWVHYKQQKFELNFSWWCGSNNQRHLFRGPLELIFYPIPFTFH